MSDAVLAAPAKRPNPLIQAWLVIVLSVGIGGGLTALELWLKPKIEANKKAETAGAAPELVGLKAGPTVTVEELLVEGRPALKVLEGGVLKGWVIPASGPGYGPQIDLLVGLDVSAKTILGLKVIAQQETPGLGDPIVKPDFLGRFTHKNTDQRFKAVRGEAKGAHEIKALTGATISSRSVCEIVNKAIAPEFREKLLAQAGGR